MKPNSLRLLGLIVITAIVYFAAAELGLSLASVHTNVSPVWPPAGIAIASLLIFGWRLWPAIFIGALVANLHTQIPVAAATGIAVGNTLEALAAFVLLNRNIRLSRFFESLREVLRFVVYAALVAPIVGATIGNLSLCLSGAASWSTPRSGSRGGWAMG